MLVKLLILSLFLSGCSGINPELIEALANDRASFCGLYDIRGGAGGIIGGATGGYGQSSLYFCRSNQPNARIEMQPDGKINIEHGHPDAQPVPSERARPRASNDDRDITESKRPPIQPILLLVR